MRRILWAVLSFLVFSVPVFAQRTCYVRDGGTATGTNGCFSGGGFPDWSDATKVYDQLSSVEAVVDRASNGAYTVYIADGTYSTGITFDAANSGTTAVTIKKAIETDHGTATGWSSTYGDGQAVFSGSGATCGGHFNIVSDYWIFDGQTRPTDWATGDVSGYGIKILGSGDKVVRLDNNACAANAYGDHITFRYIDFDGGGRDTGTGADIFYWCSNGCGGSTDINDLTIEYSALHDIDRTIFLARGTVTMMLQYSYIARNSSYPTQCGGHGEMMSSTNATSLTIRYNVIEDIEGTAGIYAGLNGGSTSGLYVYGNTVRQTSAYRANVGTRVCSTPPSTEHPTQGWSAMIYIAHDASNNNDGDHVLVYNNTIYEQSSGTTSGVFVEFGAGSNAVENNMWYDSGNVGHNIVGSSTFGYNWYYNTTNTSDGGSNKTTCSSSCSVFTDPSTNDFRLTTALAAAGTSLSSPYNTDRLGVTRGSDGTWDRGAFEFGGASCTPDHLTFTSQPSGAAVNVSLGTVTVAVKDSGGTTCTSDTSTVTLANKGGTCTGMTLGGTASGSASSGVFTTSNLTENAAGSCILTATDGALTSADSSSFTITSGSSASIASVLPISGRRGTSVAIVVTGTNTNFASNVSVCSFSPASGVTVTSTTVASATSATCNVTIQAGAALSFRSIRITTGSEYADLASAFQITGGGTQLRNLRR